MKKILLLAQIPPPFHGQAIMQKFLVDVKWQWCMKHHLPLNYSNSIQEVGHFSLSKITKLFLLFLKIWHSKRNKKIDLIYYPPAGPNRIPFYRDIATLLFVRLMAKKVILHFHAGGLSTLVEKLSPIEFYFAKLAFKDIDHAIVLLPSLRHETSWFSPKNVSVVPNGIVDVASDFCNSKVESKLVNILFVGNLKKEKGIFVLLEAIARMKVACKNFKLKVMGETHSEQIKTEILNFIKRNELDEFVDLLGPMSGADKWKTFANSSIFCLPTYATEAMPVSILEAMMFSIPTVTTNWRGIPDMITEGEEGLLVPVKNSDILAEKLILLVNDPNLAKKMGQKARKKYESCFSIEMHLSSLEKVFKSCLN